MHYLKELVGTKQFAETLDVHMVMSHQGLEYIEHIRRAKCASTRIGTMMHKHQHMQANHKGEKLVKLQCA